MRRRKPGPPRGQTLADVSRTPVGARLFKTRKARGLTQTALGQRLGVSKRVIARYESGPTTPQIEVLGRLASALGVTVSYLLGESTLKKAEDDIKPAYRRLVEIMQRLTPKQQRMIFEMAEGLDFKNRMQNQAKGDKDS
jgi:transcriptional regulator with XRE-family HTH domain